MGKSRFEKKGGFETITQEKGFQLLSRYLIYYEQGFFKGKKGGWPSFSRYIYICIPIYAAGFYISTWMTFVQIFGRAQGGRGGM